MPVVASGVSPCDHAVVNVRELEQPWARCAARALNDFNDRHPWSHNDHYHGWVVRHLPERRHRALEVGCGEGELLAKLAARFEEAHGTDLDSSVREVARRRCAVLDNVTVDATQLHELDGPYDVITMVASLHHLEVTPSLQEVSRLLAPGGRLLVVGLAPAVSFVDQIWDVTSMLVNPVRGLVKHSRRATGPEAAPAFPVRDPELSVDELRAITREILPGSVVRRRLYFRHTISWEKRPRSAPGRGRLWSRPSASAR